MVLLKSALHTIVIKIFIVVYLPNATIIELLVMISEPYSVVSSVSQRDGRYE